MNERIANFEKLLAKGPDACAAKVAEEGGELSDAVRGETDARVASEAADVLYHVFVALRSRGVSLDDVAAALAHFKRRPALGFSDCLVLEIARKAGHTPLGSFDKALATLPHTQRL